MDQELEKFYNHGFGWICRYCQTLNSQQTADSNESRLLREGEAEGKTPRLSTTSLAQWSDENRRSLECPHCGAKESLPTN